MDNLLNVNQVAFILKVHPLTIRRYIKEGKLKAVKAAGNIRVRESALSEFNKEFNPQEPQPKSFFKAKYIPPKVFNNDDPFLRLNGRGAAIKFSL